MFCMAATVPCVATHHSRPHRWAPSTTSERQVGGNDPRTVLEDLGPGPFSTFLSMSRLHERPIHDYHQKDGVGMASFRLTLDQYWEAVRPRRENCICINCSAWRYANKSRMEEETWRLRYRP